MSETQSRRPLTCCDSDCATVNRCQVGGMRCDNCGDYFCPDLGGDRANKICENCLSR